MKNLVLTLALGFLFSSIWSQANQVALVSGDDGIKLTVNSEELMINGMNWDYFPIGTNFSYSLWNQPDDIIRAALDDEMSLLKNMGVNTIRVYTGIQPKWIQYIYENYGIYTMLNHSFGRYGLTIDGAWLANTEYADPRVRDLLLDEVKALAIEYQNTPGLLLYLLGNENNYGLFWEGAETEDIPIEDRNSTVRARAMYQLFNEAAQVIHALDQSHPVALCNGDLLFMELIVEECPDIDIFGTNMYRGVSFGDAFQRVMDEYKKPILFTEFGADAFNAINNEEDQYSQAYYMVGNWKEIYENAAGLGKANNSIGGFTFQFSDGWWKYGQTKNLDIHDNNASWANGGYLRDFVEGSNNMNEEWFGICAKGPTNNRGLYTLYPRAAYYSLKEAHELDVYAPGVTLETVDAHFENIQLMDAVLRARGDKAASGSNAKLRVSNFQARFTTFNTDGSLIATPKNDDPDKRVFPDELGFDHMQSYFIGFGANPSPNMRANVNFNVLGNVADNPIDEIFYENRGRTVSVNTDEGNLDLTNLNSVAVYNADFEWNAKDFDLRGFYRTGHYHWGYEGDFFGLYPEANYGPNLDIYNGEILGIEMDGKKKLDGFKLAFGPQLWWGANPAFLLKYSKNIGKYQFSGIYHEDIADAGDAISTFAVPVPKTRRLTFHLKREFGPLGLEIGGLWGGQPLNGRKFQITKGEAENYTVFVDKVAAKDNWGGKFKLTYSKGAFNWYAQGAAMGLVATGGGDYTKTFTGWRLKDSGSGNQTNFLTGFTYSLGNWQIAPNFLWQKPIVGPMPNDVPGPGRLRNIQDDPFAVRWNRETVGGELLLTYDPTPGTWMYEWDNDRAEDAKFAMSAGFVYRHHPTAMDAAIGFFSNRTSFAFPQSVPAEDLWEAHTRIVSKINSEFGLISNLFLGKAQSNGSDDRLVYRWGGDVRMIYKRMKITTQIKVDDWGPFDYHRDFNLTYPLQLMADISTTLSRPSWFDLPNTQIGVRYTWRALNQFSPRYCPTTTEDISGVTVCEPMATGFGNGRESEFRTYILINISN